LDPPIRSSERTLFEGGKVVEADLRLQVLLARYIAWLVMEKQRAQELTFQSFELVHGILEEHEQTVVVNYWSRDQQRTSAKDILRKAPAGLRRVANAFAKRAPRLLAPSSAASPTALLANLAIGFNEGLYQEGKLANVRTWIN
jgi:fructoselysine-6-P-deglycase FrlB-like protein